MDLLKVQHFIRYVELDNRIQRISKELQSIAEKLKECEAQKAEITGQTRTALQKVHDKRKELDGYELELKAIQEDLSHKRKKLSNAQNPKEFFSLEHEIADLEKKQTPLEDLGIAAMGVLEALQNVAREIQEREPGLLAEVDQEIEALKADERHLEPLKGSLMYEMEETAQLIDPEELKRYAEMKEKVHNPIVPIIKGSCSGCFYALSKQQMVDAQNGQLVRCQDCHRLLYSPQVAGDNSAQLI